MLKLILTCLSDAALFKQLKDIPGAGMDQWDGGTNRRTDLSSYLTASQSDHGGKNAFQSRISITRQIFHTRNAANGPLPVR